MPSSGARKFNNLFFRFKHALQIVSVKVTHLKERYVDWIGVWVILWNRVDEWDEKILNYSIHSHWQEATWFRQFPNEVPEYCRSSKSGYFQNGDFSYKLSVIWFTLHLIKICYEISELIKTYLKILIVGFRDILNFARALFVSSHLETWENRKVLTKRNTSKDFLD